MRVQADVEKDPPELLLLQLTFPEGLGPFTVAVQVVPAVDPAVIESGEQDTVVTVAALLTVRLACPLLASCVESEGAYDAVIV